MADTGHRSRQPDHRHRSDFRSYQGSGFRNDQRTSRHYCRVPDHCSGWDRGGKFEVELAITEIVPRKNRPGARLDHESPSAIDQPAGPPRRLRQWDRSVPSNRTLRPTGPARALMGAGGARADDRWQGSIPSWTCHLPQLALACPCSQTSVRPDRARAIRLRSGPLRQASDLVEY